jgi:hypothetical protein
MQINPILTQIYLKIFSSKAIYLYNQYGIQKNEKNWISGLVVAITFNV